MDTVVFQTLHHFFFVIYKLLKEGDLSTIDELGKSSDSLNLMKFSIQGGFLRQPVFDCLPVNINDHSTDYSKLLEKFYYLLSKIIWPSVRRCLMEGKEFTDYSNCQVYPLFLKKCFIFYVSLLVLVFFIHFLSHDTEK